MRMVTQLVSARPDSSGKDSATPAGQQRLENHSAASSTTSSDSYVAGLAKRTLRMKIR